MDTRRTQAREGRAADERLRERYERAVRMALEWIERNKASVTRLAEYLDENRSSLSKLLNGEPSHVPTRQRPAMMRMLEKIESWCPRNELVTLWEQPSPESMSGDEDYIVVHNHAERLHLLGEKYEAIQALQWAHELCVQAVYGPPQYRSAMATNTLLWLGVLLWRLEATDASPKLLRSTAGRVARLQAVALKSVEDARSESARRDVPHKARGYGGIARVGCGILLVDDETIDQGLDDLFFAAMSEHSRADRHWDNLFLAIDRLISRSHPAIEAVLDRLIAALKDSRDANALHALAVRDFPDLMLRLEDRFPEFVQEVASERRSVERDG